jgi:hypothetical protein
VRRDRRASFSTGYFLDDERLALRNGRGCLNPLGDSELARDLARFAVQVTYPCPGPWSDPGALSRLGQLKILGMSLGMSWSVLGMLGWFRMVLDGTMFRQ